MVHTAGSLFEKQILQEAGGFDESLRVCSDYDLWLRLSLKHFFTGLPKPTYKRRRHIGNLSAYSTANHILELKVLEHFYYERGGKEVLPKNLAMRRLSQQLYRVGKCALKEGDIETAKEYFKRSYTTHLNLKSGAKRLLLTLK